MICVTSWVKVKVNIINAWCILISCLRQLPCQVWWWWLQDDFNSFRGIACEGHTHRQTDRLTLASVYLKTCSKVVISDFENKNDLNFLSLSDEDEKHVAGPGCRAWACARKISASSWKSRWVGEEVSPGWLGKMNRYCPPHDIWRTLTHDVQG